MAVYCAPRDLYDFGLPRGAVANPARLAAFALASTDTITLDLHGFDADDPVTFRAEAGGSLPAPLVAGTTYYAIPLGESAFKLAAAPGGGAIDLSSDGASVLVISPLPIAAAIEWASRIVDDMLPAGVVELAAPYPAIVRMTAAELAAGKLAGRGGFESKALGDIVIEARKRLERWGKGVPIRGENAPAPAGLSVSVSALGVARDPSGWGRFGGT